MRTYRAAVENVHTDFGIHHRKVMCATIVPILGQFTVLHLCIYINWNRSLNPLINVRCVPIVLWTVNVSKIWYMYLKYSLQSNRDWPFLARDLRPSICVAINKACVTVEQLTKKSRRRDPTQAHKCFELKHARKNSTLFRALIVHTCTRIKLRLFLTEWQQT